MCVRKPFFKVALRQTRREKNMKMKLLKKAVSLCLVLCLIVSLFGVYPVTAATVNAVGNHATRGESTDSDIKLIYNRDFEDNKAVHNGLGLSSSTASDAIEKITASDGNSYLQFNKTGNHDYLNPSLSSYSPSSGSVVVQFDFMIESDTLNLPGIFQFNPRVRPPTYMRLCRYPYRAESPTLNSLTAASAPRTELRRANGTP